MQRYEYKAGFAVERHGRPLTITFWQNDQHTLLTYDYHDGKGDVPVARGDEFGFYQLNSNYFHFNDAQVIGYQRGQPVWSSYRLTICNSHELSVHVVDGQGRPDAEHSFHSLAAEDSRGRREAPDFKLPPEHGKPLIRCDAPDAARAR